MHWLTLWRLQQVTLQPSCSGGFLLCAPWLQMAYKCPRCLTSPAFAKQKCANMTELERFPAGQNNACSIELRFCHRRTERFCSCQVGVASLLVMIKFVDGIEYAHAFLWTKCMFKGPCILGVARTQPWKGWRHPYHHCAVVILLLVSTGWILVADHEWTGGFCSTILCFLGVRSGGGRLALFQCSKETVGTPRRKFFNTNKTKRFHSQLMSFYVFQSLGWVAG